MKVTGSLQMKSFFSLPPAWSSPPPPPPAYLLLVKVSHRTLLFRAIGAFFNVSIIRRVRHNLNFYNNSTVKRFE